MPKPQVSVDASKDGPNGGQILRVHIKHGQGIKDVHLKIRQTHTKDGKTTEQKLGGTTGDSNSKNYKGTNNGVPDQGWGWQVGAPNNARDESGSPTPDADGNVTYDVSWGIKQPSGEALDDNEHDFSVEYTGTPRFDKDYLAKHAKDLVTLTTKGCRQVNKGWVFGWDPKKDEVAFVAVLPEHVARADGKRREHRSSDEEVAVRQPSPRPVSRRRG